MVFLDHEVYPYEVDVYRMIRPSQLLRFAMHMSQVQQDSEALIPPEASERVHLGWMLARFRLTQSAPAYLGETLRVECSPRAVQRAYYMREARIRRGAEEIARVGMVWIPVDMETRRILRVPELERLFSPSAPKTELQDLRRLPQAAELAPWGELKVPYSLCDSNGHFSSANYVDVVCDACGCWRDGPMRMASMQIDYHAEFLPEERLLLYGRREGGCVTACGRHADGGMGFAAVLEFEQLQD